MPDNFEIHSEENNHVVDTIEGVDNTRTPGYVPPIGTGENIDPNDVTVTIADTSTPVVILFGAPSIGKTMILRRLILYLQKDYFIQPDTLFINSPQELVDDYKKRCSDFNATIHSQYAAKGNGDRDFMLVSVYKNGRPIVQILEAPGEHYFNKRFPNANFPPYINTIISAPNKKIWCYITQLGWENSQDIRNDYSRKIKQMQSINLSSREKVIFISNAADLQPQYSTSNGPIVQSYFNDTRLQFPGIFQSYINNNPITKLWKPYNFTFIPFSTGSYSPIRDGSGRQTYVPGQAVYPAMLWQAILKARG